MRQKTSRPVGVALAGAGILMLAWTALVWAWHDPVTGLYTVLEQRRLAERYERIAADGRVAALRAPEVGRAARLFRSRVRPGDPIGRLRISRLDLEIFVVEGTDADTLKKGPGRDRRSGMPGEGKLVYLAGHRTTYLAPFARIDRLRPGDRVELEMPYASLRYEVTGHRLVAEDDLSVLAPASPETLRLQACHPRFFATQRYVVSARLVSVAPAAASELHAASAASHLGSPRKKAGARASLLL